MTKRVTMTIPRSAAARDEPDWLTIFAARSASSPWVRIGAGLESRGVGVERFSLVG